MIRKITTDNFIFGILAIAIFINLALVIGFISLEKSLNSHNLYFVIYGIPVVLTFIGLSFMRINSKANKNWQSIKWNILWPIFSIASYLVLYWYCYNFVNW